MPPKPKTQAPGFSLCNPKQVDTKMSYMRQHGQKIRELFQTSDSDDCVAFRTEVLEGLISENEEGFFVTDLSQLQDLISCLIGQINEGRDEYTQYLQKIISMSVIPFRKVSNGDDRRCFPHIGGFFAAICPVMRFNNEELRLEASKALYWYAQNCGPLNVRESSTLSDFYPQNDDVALYSIIPTQLHVSDVITVFTQNFLYILEDNQNPPSDDVLTLCLKSLIEFVKRGQTESIPTSTLNAVLKLMTTPSTENSPVVNEEILSPQHAAPRVLVHALYFIDVIIQESEEMMNVCATNSFLSSLWSFFVDFLFMSFKKSQKRARNEVLNIIILALQSQIGKESQFEKTLVVKMFDLCQTIAVAVPDSEISVSYSTKTKNLRLTHDDVDIELILFSQDLALTLYLSVSLPQSRNDFIEHQVTILKGEQNRYLVPHRQELVKQALQILHHFVQDQEHFISIQGPETICDIFRSTQDPEITRLVLLLSIKLHPVFAFPDYIDCLLSAPRDTNTILALVLSALAILMEDKDSIATQFIESGGEEILLEAIKSESSEVVTCAIDCMRSIAPYHYQNLDQRFVFTLLDCADQAPVLIRFSFVGLFLDILKSEGFVESALQWQSLKTHYNIQKTIVQWWKEEERRQDIYYDKSIIIDIDKPLEGHPLASRPLKKVVVDQNWLLDKNSIQLPTKPYKLDFRSRLYILINAFPQLNEADSKPTDRIKELMIRNYKQLKAGTVWMKLKEQLAEEKVKPLHDDRARIEQKLTKMRSLSLDIQEKQCEIWQKCENDRLAVEQRTYNQLSEGLKTAQFVAENYKAIVSAQPISVSRPTQGRTVKGEDVLVRTGNLRNLQKAEVRRSISDEDTSTNDLQIEKELEENYINDCLNDESISYLVQLMKNTAR